MIGSIFLLIALWKNESALLDPFLNWTRQK